MKFEERLINLVKENELLYNSKDSNYRRLDLKQKTWRDIGEALGVSDKKCRQRWRSLRDRFKREWKRKQQKTDGMSDPRIVWRYYNSLSFLRNVDEAKLNNNVTVTVKTQDNQDGTISPIDFEDLVSKTVMDGAPEIMTNLNPAPITNITQEQTPVAKDQRKKKELSNTVHDEFRSFLSSASTALQSRHPTAVLFESLAMKIMNACLPIGVQNQLESDVFNLVYERVTQYGNY